MCKILKLPITFLLNPEAENNEIQPWSPTSLVEPGTLPEPLPRTRDTPELLNKHRHPHMPLAYSLHYSESSLRNIEDISNCIKIQARGRKSAQLALKLTSLSLNFFPLQMSSFTSTPQDYRENYVKAHSTLSIVKVSKETSKVSFCFPLAKSWVLFRQCER
jgi:hypothetical protein